MSSPLVSSLNLYVKVESGIVDLLLILAAVASRDDRLPGRTSTQEICRLDAGFPLLSFARSVPYQGVSSWRYYEAVEGGYLWPNRRAVVPL
jgi:hypothetical protein